MTARQKRLLLVVVGFGLVAAATALILTAFRDHLVFFVTPSELLAGKGRAGQYLRVGGLVEEGSLQRIGDGLSVVFRITDTAQAIPVTYRGVLPDLFGENQGAVVEGIWRSDGVLEARKVLAKHDETYMPPEAAKAVQEAQSTLKSLKEH